MALTILLAKFSVLFILCHSLIPNLSYARESFEFDLGQKINVLSDKAFRKSSQNEFEAVGNVVITHLRNSIYGEKARIDFSTGETEVIGNVRYISPETTLYGTKLKYNFISKRIDLDNARVLSDNYVVTGKKIIQTSSDAIYGEEAEYTTCKDCPESWSIFGKKINITIGKYVRITHAFIKVNGVITMYIPYIVFPIKQKRESGVLFPLLGFSSDDGFRYQQPFFWVIDDYKDMTLTPSTFGNRGFGGEFQYRQNVAEKTWLELNSIQLNDKIYAPNKTTKTLSGKKEYRHFSDFENHFGYKHFVNSHIYFTDTSDLDTTRDLDFFAENKIRGTETGGGGFLEGRSSLFSFGIQSYYNKNILVTDPTKFDHDYVQILPKLSFSTVPYNIIHSQYPFLKNISLGFGGDYTIFKQNRINPIGPIRNARRLNLSPYVDWQLGNLGPVFFSHTTKVDFQKYSLPTEQDKSFSKKGLIYETEAKFELEKIYGLSYTEESPIEIDEESEREKQRAEEKITTIGILPKLRSAGAGNESKLIVNNSYRHSQEVKFKHFYLSDQTYTGNTNFKKQIEQDSGQFDYLDALRDREHLSNQTTASDSLPLSNTLEFQWNNNLIQKAAKKFDPYKDERYLKDNFSYTDIAYFNLSQGLDLTVNSERLEDRLTRLYASTGFTVGSMSFSIQEFYLHRSQEHKLSSSTAYSGSRFNISGRFTYNSFNSSNTPITKLIGYSWGWSLNDLITLNNSLDYNFESKLVTGSSYSVLYSPLNNCWKIAANYSRDLIDSKFALLFYINYNNNNYTPINVR